MAQFQLENWCDFCNCMERDFQFTEETAPFLSLTADDLTKLKKRILDCRRTHQEQEDHILRSMIPAEGDCFFVVFSDQEEHYFQDAILWNGIKVVHYSSYVHLGMFQDSVLINRPLDDGGAEEWIDFRYFHYAPNSLEFYLWEGFTGPVYAANQGERAMQVKTPGGTFRLPPDGWPYRINGVVKTEQLQMKFD